MFDFDVSEFVDKLFQQILKAVYDPLYESVQNSFNDLFRMLNDEVSKASDNIKIGPKQWDGQAFASVKEISETVCIPIAAAFITVIFCWELIHLVQESNSMNNAKPDKIMMVLLKFGLCLLVCAKSFDIIMGFYDIGAWAATQLGSVASSDIREFNVELNDILDLAPQEYTVGLLMKLCGYKIILFLGKFGIAVCGVIVYVRVMLWFMEILLYASVAPIPYSTWVNMEVTASVMGLGIGAAPVVFCIMYKNNGMGMEKYFRYYYETHFVRNTDRPYQVTKRLVSSNDGATDTDTQSKNVTVTCINGVFRAERRNTATRKTGKKKAEYSLKL